jgi:hypothetical protein
VTSIEPIHRDRSIIRATRCLRCGRWRIERMIRTRRGISARDPRRIAPYWRTIPSAENAGGIQIGSSGINIGTSGVAITDSAGEGCCCTCVCSSINSATITTSGISLNCLNTGASTSHQAVGNPNTTVVLSPNFFVSGGVCQSHTVALAGITGHTYSALACSGSPSTSESLNAFMSYNDSGHTWSLNIGDSVGFILTGSVSSPKCADSITISNSILAPGTANGIGYGGSATITFA